MNQSNTLRCDFPVGSETRIRRVRSAERPRILTINGGSSSLKFALFERTNPTCRLMSGRVDRIGLADARWVMAEPGGGRKEDRPVHAPDQKAAVRLLIDWLEHEVGFAEIAAVGHRVVHGGSRYHHPEPITPDLIMEELARIANPEEAQGRVILAHLGAGASLAAVRGGHSIDTSMGFTPASGLVMGTRTGDLDPGLVRFLSQTEGITADQFDSLVNHESGLLGVSETSSDVRDLLARQNVDVRAAEAIELFCYQAKKWIGAFAAALGGIDTLVFAGGIGENAPEIRRRICEGLGFLGITLDEGRNACSNVLISTDRGPVKVRVIQTDEALMIARAVARLTARPS